MIIQKETQVTGYKIVIDLQEAREFLEWWQKEVPIGATDKVPLFLSELKAQIYRDWHG